MATWCCIACDDGDDRDDATKKVSSDDLTENGSADEGGMSALDDDLDGGDQCPAGWQLVDLYTEPGCDPAPTARKVCAPNIWDASCEQICGCDGVGYCASVFGTSDSWDYGLPAPFSDADPSLDCELTDENDAAPRDDETSDDRTSSDDKTDVRDAEAGPPVPLDSQEGGTSNVVDDPPDASRGGASDILDASPGCPAGWSSVELFTEPGCGSDVSAERVCAPDIWDAGCQNICGCDGQTYCGAVWGSSNEWAYGLHVQFTDCGDASP
jgi:hypothetical protein